MILTRSCRVQLLLCGPLRFNCLTAIYYYDSGQPAVEKLGYSRSSRCLNSIWHGNRARTAPVNIREERYQNNEPIPNIFECINRARMHLKCGIRRTSCMRAHRASSPALSSSWPLSNLRPIRPRVNRKLYSRTSSCFDCIAIAIAVQASISDFLKKKPPQMRGIGRIFCIPVIFCILECNRGIHSEKGVWIKAMFRETHTNFFKAFVSLKYSTFKEKNNFEKIFSFKE